MHPENSVTNTAMANGFESLSDFNDTFKKLTGTSPVDSSNVQWVTVTRLLTPLGSIFAGVSEKGVCLLEFTDRRMLETQVRRLTKLFHAQFVPGEHPVLHQLDHELKEYFAGTRKAFSIPLDFSGTNFQRSVWGELMNIPYGKTRTYQQQADAINNINAVRAVAKCNGDNRISIIIPCHRVIGKNGKLTGYSGGLWRKQRLLELESGQRALTG